MEKDDILAEIKPMLNFDEQIAKLKQMNIFFNIIDTEKANEILRKNNYFFKLAYFRKNFEKKEWRLFHRICLFIRFSNYRYEIKIHNVAFNFRY
ncbi:hypothetical protein BG717_00635 [Staphylococcus aureus]|nr:hypothetical protein V695_00252 [Staphylococcus aureus M25139]EYQ89935.1 hypothetical protein W279_00359 [Staphylococcus aureus DAR3152]EYR48587.1 hypothetical protein W305_02390 [Staphylococcus aureus DAR5872]EYR52110.1 hypothetical protein W306_02079 [Staphylococcus aureus DAR5871]EYR58826.1 hypothetical protein W309_01708 [Staphylococcus aureus DAR5868]OZH12324.1 hypothetical protein BG722_11040 [Staphylococcus aureus]